MASCGRGVHFHPVWNAPFDFDANLLTATRVKSNNELRAQWSLT